MMAGMARKTPGASTAPDLYAHGEAEPLQGGELTTWLSLNQD